MIPVTNLHGHKLYVNAELIEFIEENPETQLVMTSGNRMYVKEKAAELADRVMEYRRQCMLRPELILRDENE